MRRTFSARLDCPDVAMFKILYLFPALLLTGCQLIPALPPVDLAAPGWSMVEGQAIWRPKRDAPELAGEFLLATNVIHAIYFQFNKAPFPLVVAQASANGWQLEIPTKGKIYSGPGAAPARIIWLRLPALLRGEPPPGDWTWARSGETWTLKNKKTGEEIQGVFTTPVAGRKSPDLSAPAVVRQAGSSPSAGRDVTETSCAPAQPRLADSPEASP
jgi:hypothetical protein